MGTATKENSRNFHAQWYWAGRIENPSYQRVFIGETLAVPKAAEPLQPNRRSSRSTRPHPRPHRHSVLTLPSNPFLRHSSSSNAARPHYDRATSSICTHRQPGSNKGRRAERVVG